MQFWRIPPSFKKLCSHLTPNKCICFINFLWYSPLIWTTRIEFLPIIFHVFNQPIKKRCHRQSICFSVSGYPLINKRKVTEPSGNHFPSTGTKYCREFHPVLCWHWELNSHTGHKVLNIISCSQVSTDSQSRGAFKIPLNERQTLRREEVFVCFLRLLQPPHPCTKLSLCRY